jgi:hypothetical protein
MSIRSLPTPGEFDPEALAAWSKLLTLSTRHLTTRGPVRLVKAALPWQSLVARQSLVVKSARLACRDRTCPQAAKIDKFENQHVNQFRDRHGRLRFYFRRRGSKVIPLPVCQALRSSCRHMRPR